MSKIQHPPAFRQFWRCSLQEERGAVVGVIEGKTKTQAMIDAGYSETTAVKR